jgi:2-amino-4-hydroxy-6-hydroxymethyldihydropteridine diphosphokinase
VSDGWTSCVVALGSNKGDREHEAFSALADLRATEGFRVTAHSSLQETVALTEAGPDPSAPAYMNQIILLDSAWSAQRTLDALLAIEVAHARERSGVRWEPRTLDLDLICYGDLVTQSDTLTLPHPRASERRFVLAPWLEIDPDASIPGFGRVADLLAALPSDAP